MADRHRLYVDVIGGSEEACERAADAVSGWARGFGLGLDGWGDPRYHGSADRFGLSDGLDVVRLDVALPTLEAVHLFADRLHRWLNANLWPLRLDYSEHNHRDSVAVPAIWCADAADCCTVWRGTPAGLAEAATVYLR